MASSTWNTARASDPTSTFQNLGSDTGLGLRVPPPPLGLTPLKSTGTPGRHVNHVSSVLSWPHRPVRDQVPQSRLAQCRELRMQRRDDKLHRLGSHLPDQPRQPLVV